LILQKTQSQSDFASFASFCSIPLLLAAKLLILFRTDLRPQSDQLDSHSDNLVRKQSFWIRAETITAAKALNGAFNFRQGTGDQRWNHIRVVHMFK
jgi:hypothetical protein